MQTNERKLYLVAYDICQSKRLARTSKVVRAMASGGQKSAYECYLTKNELHSMAQELKIIIDQQQDSVLLIPIDSEAPVALLGAAELPLERGLVYLGSKGVRSLAFK